MKSNFLKSFIILFSFTLSFGTFAFSDGANLDSLTSTTDNTIGGRKKNNPSPASRRALSRQSKKAQRSIRMNERRHKKVQRHCIKRQKKQARFSRKKTFR